MSPESPKNPFCSTWSPSTSRNAASSKWVAEWLAAQAARLSVSTHAMNGASRCSGSFLVIWIGRLFPPFCVDDFNRFELIDQYAGIAYLTAAFGIERSLVQYNLEQCLVFLLYLAVAQNGCFIFRIIVAYKFGSAFLQCNPVSGFNGSGIACTLLFAAAFRHRTL